MRLAAPPEGCSYQFERDERGCDIFPPRTVCGKKRSIICIKICYFSENTADPCAVVRCRSCHQCKRNGDNEARCVFESTRGCCSSKKPDFSSYYLPFFQTSSTAFLIRAILACVSASARKRPRAAVTTAVAATHTSTMRSGMKFAPRAIVEASYKRDRRCRLPFLHLRDFCSCINNAYYFLTKHIHLNSFAIMKDSNESTQVSTILFHNTKSQLKFT